MGLQGGFVKQNLGFWDKLRERGIKWNRSREMSWKLGVIQGYNI